MEVQGKRIAMKGQMVTILLSLSLAAIVASAQSTAGKTPSQAPQVHDYWVDPSTKLMWTAKDNGKDVNWHDAAKYCRKLRLANYPDWRLAELDELSGIYDRSANAPGRAGSGAGRTFTWHVKGNLFLTGNPWSSSQRTDDRGHLNGLAWYFNFAEGRENDDDAGRFSGRFANHGLRALCVRESEIDASHPSAGGSKSN